MSSNITFKNRSDVRGFTITDSRVGVGTATPCFAFHVVGECRMDTDFVVENIQNASDERFKINVENIEIPQDNIKDLEPVQYNWTRNPDGSVVFGFIAQDIVTKFPHLVKVDAGGNYSLDYVQFIPVIVRELKRQMDEITDLTKEVSYLKNVIEEECKKLNKNK